VKTRSFGRSWGSVVAIRLGPGTSLPAELTSFVPLSTPLLSTRFAGSSRAQWLLVGAVPQRVLRSIDQHEFAG